MTIYYPTKKAPTIADSVGLVVLKGILIVIGLVLFWYVFVIILIFGMVSDNLKRK